jgi:NAD-dependent deacetylase
MQKRKLVVLTGAGISAESGLKTFRDSDGLWEGYDVREVATPRAWKSNPARVLDFYNMRRRDVAAAEPNAAHKGLCELETDFDVTVITQNIDDLHERGGSKKILHLHGEIFKMRSEKDPALVYPIRGDINLGDRADDGAQLRPHIVWFEEPVPAMEQALPIARNADIFAVIGTSLAVYPAAGLVHYVPPHVPIYVIDKNIPYFSAEDRIHAIQKPATEGVRELISILRAH